MEVLPSRRDVLKRRVPMFNLVVPTYCNTLSAAHYDGRLISLDTFGQRPKLLLLSELVRGGANMVDQTM